MDHRLKSAVQLKVKSIKARPHHSPVKVRLYDCKLSPDNLSTQTEAGGDTAHRLVLETNSDIDRVAEQRCGDPYLGSATSRRLSWDADRTLADDGLQGIGTWIVENSMSVSEYDTTILLDATTPVKTPGPTSDTNGTPNSQASEMLTYSGTTIKCSKSKILSDQSASGECHGNPKYESKPRMHSRPPGGSPVVCAKTPCASENSKCSREKIRHLNSGRRSPE